MSSDVAELILNLEQENTRGFKLLGYNEELLIEFKYSATYYTLIDHKLGKGIRVKRGSLDHFKDIIGEKFNGIKYKLLDYNCNISNIEFIGYNIFKPYVLYTWLATCPIPHFFYLVQIIECIKPIHNPFIGNDICSDILKKTSGPNAFTHDNQVYCFYYLDTFYYLEHFPDSSDNTNSEWYKIQKTTRHAMEFLLELFFHCEFKKSYNYGFTITFNGRNVDIKNTSYLYDFIFIKTCFQEFTIK
jgi:hypothetical protein